MAKAGIVYVGTDNGLVTFSDPGGTGRWRRVGQSLEGLPIRAILASEALILTVADASGAAQRTEDGGQTWGPASGEDTELLAALIGATGPLVATAQGLGQWRGSHAPAPGAKALALLSGKQEVLIAAIAGGTVLMRSEDGGASWQQATTSAPLEGNVTIIAPASYHMDMAWAGTDAGQLLRSDDRGRTWAVVAAGEAPIRALAVERLI